MQNPVAAIIVAGSVLVAGCGPSEPVEETVFDPMVESLDKARDAEDKVLDAAAEVRARIDGLQTDPPE